MRKQPPPSNKREAREAQRRAKQRQLWYIGAGALVLVAVIGVIVYFAAIRDNAPAQEESGPQVTELVTEDLIVGTGEAAQAGDSLSVYYTLYFLDGTEVQSNVGSTSFQFTLGAGKVIKGWDQGLVGMKEGGTRKLTIPSDLAYGAAGQGTTIPPNTPLVFEVQLVAIA